MLNDSKQILTSSWKQLKHGIHFWSYHWVVSLTFIIYHSWKVFYLQGMFIRSQGVRIVRVTLCPSTFLFEIVLEMLFEHFELLKMRVKIFKRFRHPKLNWSCRISHVMDDHVHEDSIGINLLRQRINFFLKKEALDLGVWLNWRGDKAYLLRI